MQHQVVSSSDKEMVNKEIKAFFEEPKDIMPSFIEKEAILFFKDKKIQGYSLIERENDVKKARVIYQVNDLSSKEEMNEMIEETTNYLFLHKNILDIYYQGIKNPRLFLNVASNNGYDCCIDQDMVIYSKDYEEIYQMTSRKK